MENENEQKFNIKKGSSVVVLSNTYTALADYYSVTDKDMIRVQKESVGFSMAPKSECLMHAGIFNPSKNRIKNPS